MSNPERILFVRLSHLGDVVQALPVYWAVRGRWPNAEIAWVTQAEHAELLEGLPGLARVFLFERRGGAMAWPRIRSELKRFDADLAIDAQGNLKSAFVTLFSGAARRIGLHRSDWREPIGAMVLSETARPTSKAIPHAMDRTLALLRLIGASGEGELRRDPGLSSAERARGEELWQRFFGRSDSQSADDSSGVRAVILQLSRPEDVRSWSVDHLRAFAGELERRGTPHLLVSGSLEARYGSAFERDLPPSPLRRHWIAQSGLRELAAFFSAAAMRGARLVGSDTGPLHLAAACGLDVVCLAGPQSYLRTGPWPVPGETRRGSRHRVVLAEEPPSCAPCLKRRCTHPQGPVCMNGIAVSAVAEAALTTAAT